MKKKVWIPLLILCIIGMTYFLGPVPDTPEYSDRWPEMPQSLATLEDNIRKRETTLPLRKDNEARILWQDSLHRTEYSFVYLHGFAGSYRDGYPLNVNIADTFGANVFLGRMPGHGMKSPSSMEEFSSEKAWEYALEALAIGHQIGEKVIIISTSTGGTLAIKLASAFPDSVHALINISPNIRDNQMGASLLNTPWGHEIAHLVSLGKNRKVRHQEPEAWQYWDTLYAAEALIELQVLVETTMKPETFEEVQCPVLTLYYQKNLLQEDDHVEVDEYPGVHEAFATPDSLWELTALAESKSHFIGSSIKSGDYRTAQEEVLEFCKEKLKMKVKK